MTTLFVNAAGFTIANLVAPMPSITDWQRLEADPAELDLAAGLEGRIADPLWLIGRQWQFAELRGEDAGMPVWARLSGASGPLSLPGRAGGPDELPEPLVEAEFARDAVASIAVEAGLDLEQALVENEAEAFVAAFRAAFPLALAPHPEDAAGLDLATLAGGRAIDAVALAAAMEAGRDADGTIRRLPAQIALPPGQDEAAVARAVAAARGWLEDWTALLVDPQGAGSWRARRMEYAFSMIAGAGEAGVPLEIAEYGGGGLDWWAMDLVPGAVAAASAATLVTAERVPGAVRFPGMAADRLFEFEDGSVNFGPVTAGPTSLVTMLLIEFILAASNDWYQLPLTLDYGSSFRLGKLVVLDSFGVEATIGPAAAGPTGWSMFAVTARRGSADDGALFVLPAAIANALESEPIEEVALFRDEMANLVWAAERRVPGLTVAAIAPHPQELALHQSIDDAAAADAALVYRLQTPTPFNWHPLTAEPDPDGGPGSVLLRLRRLRRTLAGGVPDPDPGPRGTLLRGGEEEEGLRIEEREVPRSGIVVTRSFQCARDAAGNRLVWLGRRKQVGRGEGSSGLRFDVLDPIAPPDRA